MNLPRLMDLGKAGSSVLRAAALRRSPNSANFTPPDTAQPGFDAVLAARQQKNSPTPTQSNSPQAKVSKSKDDSSSHSGTMPSMDDKPHNPSADPQPTAQSQSETSESPSDAPQDAPAGASSCSPAPNTAAAAVASQSLAAASLTPAIPVANTMSVPDGSAPSSQSPPSVPSALPAPVLAQSGPGKTAPSSLTPPGIQPPQPLDSQSAQSPAASDDHPAAKAPNSSDLADPAPIPPRAADQEGKQAHEKTRHAAHVQSLESETPSADQPAPQPAPAPAALPAWMEAALAESGSSTLPLKNNTPVTPAASTSSQDLLAGAPPTTAAQTHADPAPAAQESPRTAAPDTMDQIVLGLKAKLDARSGKAEILLNPPNLGVMKVSISLDNGALTADFQSPSSLVRDLLKDNMEKLKTVLQDQGVAVDRLAVQAPPDAATSGRNPGASFGSATHDGRSAGQFQQDPRPGQQRSAGGGGDGFARFFTQAQEAPLDLVA